MIILNFIITVITLSIMIYIIYNNNKVLNNIQSNQERIKTAFHNLICDIGKRNEICIYNESKQLFNEIVNKIDSKSSINYSAIIDNKNNISTILSTVQDINISIEDVGNEIEDIKTKIINLSKTVNDINNKVGINYIDLKDIKQNIKSYKDYVGDIATIITSIDESLNIIKDNTKPKAKTTRVKKTSTKEAKISSNKSELNNCINSENKDEIQPKTAEKSNKLEKLKIDTSINKMDKKDK